MYTDRREIDCQTPVELNAAFDGVNELWDIAVAWVETRVCVDDTDDGTRQGIFTVSECLDEHFPQEEGEVGVAVGCEPLSETGSCG